MTKHEFIEYVKTNGKEIALGTLCAVGGIALIVLGVKGFRSSKGVGGPVEMIGDIVSDVNWADNNVVDGFTTGKVNDLWNEGGCANAIVQYFKIKDMGTLGEDLLKIKGITEETEVGAVLSFINTQVEI